MKKQTIYGIQTTVLNNHSVYSYKVKVTNNEFNLLAVTAFGTPFYICKNKQGKEIINLEHVTMDHVEFSSRKAILVECLKKIALNKIEDKYKIMAL